MEMERKYSQYHAWLQKGGTSPTKKMRLVAHEGVGKTAVDECTRGMKRLFGPDIFQSDSDYSIILKIDNSLPKESYRLTTEENGFYIEGGDQSGVLYGVFATMLRLGSGEVFENINENSAPAVPLRLLNHWDNLDGSVERGYAGKSIFFKGGDFSYDPDRIKDYARLLASVGINGLAINNVNVTPQSAKLITAEMLPKVAALADLFRPYGIRLILSVHFESPVVLGDLTTSDPLDQRVADWWKSRSDEVYSYIPDLLGFLVKADSEFRGGPATFGRTQADGANMLAKALIPYNGQVFWRCFVYDYQQDWRDKSTDRPKAAFEHFQPLDGLFEPNVILQIKFGPVDFQVHEPLSPLFGAMKYTSQGMELQVAQEYTGQQIDLYALAVQWEEVFTSFIDEQRSVRDLIGKEIDTVCGVSNIGDDNNWTGSILAQANLFSFGRMVWSPELTSDEILREWVQLTFGSDPSLVESLTGMMLASRKVYAKYTAPLGIGWMVNPGNHYGPSVDGYEYGKWGTYHRADHKEIGVDRTSRGTGLTLQYDPWLAGIYDNVETCPEELLLFFHRLPYDFILKSGKTLIQHIYDTHFEGVEEVKGFIRLWSALKDKLPKEAFESVKERLDLQLSNAIEWRDVINTYFYRKTGIPDSLGRTIFK